MKKKIADLTASLSNARAEIKSLSAKLAASRAAEASIKVPGSALKSGTVGIKAGPSEVILAAQAKEDLYGDLTGLIVRGMSRADEDTVFDCIQTGRNGSKFLGKNLFYMTYTDQLKLFISNWLWKRGLAPRPMTTLYSHIDPSWMRVEITT